MVPFSHHITDPKEGTSNPEHDNIPSYDNYQQIKHPPTVFDNIPHMMISSK
jgi:hypothetical protein